MLTNDASSHDPGCDHKQVTCFGRFRDDPGYGDITRVTWIGQFHDDPGYYEKARNVVISFDRSFDSTSFISITDCLWKQYHYSIEGSHTYITRDHRADYVPKYSSILGMWVLDSNFGPIQKPQSLQPPMYFFPRGTLPSTTKIHIRSCMAPWRHAGFGVSFCRWPPLLAGKRRGSGFPPFCSPPTKIALLFVLPIATLQFSRTSRHRPPTFPKQQNGICHPVTRQSHVPATASSCARESCSCSRWRPQPRIVSSASQGSACRRCCWKTPSHDSTTYVKEAEERCCSSSGGGKSRV